MTTVLIFLAGGLFVGWQTITDLDEDQTVRAFGNMPLVAAVLAIALAFGAFGFFLACEMIRHHWMPQHLISN